MDNHDITFEQSPVSSSLFVVRGDNVPAWSPKCMSVYSSFILILPALLSDDILIRALFSIITCVSILHHSYYYLDYPGKRIIDSLDSWLVHLTVAYTVYLAFTTKQTVLVMIYYICLFYMIYVFYIGRQVWIPGEEGDKWHVSMHVMAMIGTICLLKSRNMLIK